MKTKRARITLVTLTAIVGVAFFGLVAACTDDSAIHENVPQDSGAKPSDGSAGNDGTVIITGDSGIPVNCFAGDAQTYEEIINACTPATKVDKHPTLPLLLADGGLPALP